MNLHLAEHNHSGNINIWKQWVIINCGSGDIKRQHKNNWTLDKQYNTPIRSSPTAAHKMKNCELKYHVTN